MWWAEHALPLFQERSRKWASSSSCSTLWSMTLATRDMCRNVMCSNWIFGITVESLLSLQSHQANWAIITSTGVGVKSRFGCSFCNYPLLHITAHCSISEGFRLSAWFHSTGRHRLALAVDLDRHREEELYRQYQKLPVLNKIVPPLVGVSPRVKTKSSQLFDNLYPWDCLPSSKVKEL